MVKLILKQTLDGTQLNKIIKNTFLNYKQGRYKQFYENGNIRIIEYYKNNKLSKRCEYDRFKDDLLLEENVYKNNQLCKYISYDCVGKLKADYTYQDGKLHGICKTYFEGHSVVMHSSYENGKLNGISKIYKFGTLKKECTFKNNILHGISKLYDNGTCTAVVVFCDGLLESYESDSYIEIELMRIFL